MINLFVAPGAAYFSLALAGAFMAAIGVVWAGANHSSLTKPALFWNLSRSMVGQIGGIVLAAMFLLTLLAADVRGAGRTLLIAAALASYLALAVVLPRRPQVQREREAAQLRRLTPGLIAFIRVALSSFEAPVAIMQRYCAQPNSRRAIMQGLVAEALHLSSERRMRPFAALAEVARSRACRELRDVTEALATAEVEGASVQQVLAAQQETLELILQSEFKRMLAGARCTCC